MKVTQVPMCLLLPLLNKCVPARSAQHYIKEGSHKTTAGEASVSIRIRSLTWNLVYAYFIKKCLVSAHSAVIAAREMGWCPSGPRPGFVLGLSNLGV